MGDSAWDAREIGKLISSKAVDFITESAGKDNPFFLYYCSPMCHGPHCPPDEFDGKRGNSIATSRHGVGFRPASETDCRRFESEGRL